MISKYNELEKLQKTIQELIATYEREAKQISEILNMLELLRGFVNDKAIEKIKENYRKRLYEIDELREQSYESLCEMQLLSESLICAPPPSFDDGDVFTEPVFDDSSARNIKYVSGPKYAVTLEGAKLGYREALQTGDQEAIEELECMLRVCADSDGYAEWITEEIRDEVTCSNWIMDEIRDEVTCSNTRVAPRKVELDKVKFSAVAPKSLTKDSYSIIDVVMYEEAFRNEVDEIIANADEPVKETKSGVVAVESGSMVSVVLSSPDIEIDDNIEEQIWQGDYLRFSFAVQVPEDYTKKQILFTAAVCIDNVIATKLKFIANINSAGQGKIEVDREDIFSAFVSYASNDRNHVAAIVQGMKRVRPEMDIFFDVDSLRSGDDWEKRIYQEIDNRDVFYLCWSRNARDSKWVDSEWRYALKQKGVESIEPVAIEPPNLCPPPLELSKKHFNDKMLYIIYSDAPFGGESSENALNMMVW